MWVVEIMEYERGWGSRLDETKEFGPDGSDKIKADEFVKKFNKRNDSKDVPDWYMVAQGPFWRQDKPIRR